MGVNDWLTIWYCTTTYEIFNMNYMYWYLENALIIFKSVKLVAYFIRINRKIPLNYNYTCTNVLQSTIFFFLVWFVLQNLFRALSNSNCKIDCSRKKYRPVCGSDGVTYKHRCELKRAKRCDKKKVKVKRKGPCSRE